MKHKFYILISAGLIFVSLQSCFVAKDYNQPDFSSLSEDLYHTDMLPQDSLSMAQLSWKELFTDPILASHIENALTNNLDIRIAIERVNVANSYYLQGKTGYLPSVNAYAGVGYQRNFGDSPSDVTQYELIGNLSWEADVWGKIRSSKRASESAYLQTVAGHQAVKSQLVAQIATLYYQLLALDEQLKIAEETIGNRTNSLQTTQALKEAGQLTEVAVKQTEAQLKNVEGIRLDILREIRLVENTFSVLLGSSPKNIERGVLENQEITSELKIGYPLQLLSNRPDVTAAEYGLIYAFEMTNVARSQFYPSLTLTATGGLQSLEFDDLFSTNSLFANILGRLTQPIFNKRQIKMQYEVAQAQQEEAYYEFKRSVLMASKEVSDALYSIEIANQKVQTKTEEYNAYNQAMIYSEELINSGFGSYLEVLTARESTLNAQISLALLKFEKLRATVDLYRALGGGWN